MQLILAAALVGSALAGHASTSKPPGKLLTGCPNGYTNIMTGECKPYHLRIRDAATADWTSHKVTDAYHVVGGGDHNKNAYPGADKVDDWATTAHFTGPSEHCPNGVANHGSGECRPFKMHARDADGGAWREHFVTGAYKIPDEKMGAKGAFGGAAHGAPQGHEGGFFGDAKGGKAGGKGGW